MVLAARNGHFRPSLSANRTQVAGHTSSAGSSFTDGSLGGAHGVAYPDGRRYGHTVCTMLATTMATIMVPLLPIRSPQPARWRPLWQPLGRHSGCRLGTILWWPNGRHSACHLVFKLTNTEQKRKAKKHPRAREARHCTWCGSYSCTSRPQCNG